MTGGKPSGKLRPEVVITPLKSTDGYKTIGTPWELGEGNTPELVARVQYLESQLSATQRSLEGLRRYILSSPWAGAASSSNIPEPAELFPGFGLHSPLASLSPHSFPGSGHTAIPTVVPQETTPITPPTISVDVEGIHPTTTPTEMNIVDTATVMTPPAMTVNIEEQESTTSTSESAIDRGISLPAEVSAIDSVTPTTSTTVPVSHPPRLSPAEVIVIDTATPMTPIAMAVDEGEPERGPGTATPSIGEASGSVVSHPIPHIEATEMSPENLVIDETNGKLQAKPSSPPAAQPLSPPAAQPLTSAAAIISEDLLPTSLGLMTDGLSDVAEGSETLVSLNEYASATPSVDEEIKEG